MNTIFAIIAALSMPAILFVESSSAQSSESPNPNLNLTQKLNFRFISGNRAEGIPFQVCDNTILIQARVNGSKPLWVIFQPSSFLTAIDTKLADELKLEMGGRRNTNSHSITRSVGEYRRFSFYLPNVELFNQVAVPFDGDGNSRWFGRKVSGVIGYEALKDFVIEIDHENSIINLYRPDNYDHPVSGEAVPFVYKDGRIEIKTTVSINKDNIVEGQFALGSDSPTEAILINTPFVNDHQIMDVINEKQVSLLDSATTYITRMESLSLGQYILHSPTVRISRTVRGEGGREDYDGAIGGEVLRRFKLVIDFPHESLYLEPNKYFSDPFEVDMSGLILIANGPEYSEFVVWGVLASGPAASAGIQKGDKLIMISGSNAKELGLEQIRNMFRESDREFSLVIKRGDTTINIKLKTKRFL